MKIQIRKILPESIAAVILIALSAYLLGGDVWTFWTWWLLALFMGMVAMPVTGRLFEGFEDKGWLFSKALAIAVTGFLTWFLAAVKLLPFTAATCIGVSVICGILFHVQLKKGIECYPSGKIQLIVREELLFFGIFLLWTYLAGFRPQAYGTEKFMDYGFMEAMMRSKTLPARDLWYSQGTINYYYGGQYFAVFLICISVFPGKTDGKGQIVRTHVWDKKISSVTGWSDRWNCGFHCRKCALHCISLRAASDP